MCVLACRSNLLQVAIEQFPGVYVRPYLRDWLREEAREIERAYTQAARNLELPIRGIRFEVVGSPDSRPFSREDASRIKASPDGASKLRALYELDRRFQEAVLSSFLQYIERHLEEAEEGLDEFSELWDPSPRNSGTSGISIPEI